MSTLERFRRGRLRRVRSVAIVTVLVVAGLMWIGAAQAVHDNGMFELDGNVVHNSATTPPYDWTSLFGATGNQLIAPDPITGPVLASTFVDDTDAIDNTYFAGGTKIDDQVHNMGCGGPAANDKTSMDYVYVALIQVPPGAPDNAGHQVLYLGIEKQAAGNGGDNAFGFWLFQNKNVGCDASVSTSFTGAHTDGDLFIDGLFTNGGGTSDVQVFRWNGDDVTGSLGAAPIFTGNVCGAVAGNDNVCAIANDSTITAGPWRSSPTMAANTFVEAGIDMTNLLGQNGGCFSTFLADSQSSQSTSSQPKDYASGQFNTCVPPIIGTTATPGGSVNPIGVSNQHDVATITGVGNRPDPTGTIDFFLCNPSQVTAGGCVSGGTQVGGDVTVAAGSATSANASGLLTNAAGKYCWRAEYTPDTAGSKFYLAQSHTNSTTECFFVQASPSIGTTVSESTGRTGDSISDSATLSGTSNLLGTGSVTFYLYAPGSTCHNDGSGSPVYTHVASSTVSTNGPFASGSFGPPLVAGTYQWVAVFSGDANNNSASSGCGSEPVKITASPTIVTTPSETSGSLGDLLNDTADLEGGSNFDGNGEITFNLYGPNDPTCHGEPAYTETVPADHNGSDYATSNSTVTADRAGTWNWTASFFGDANNNPVSSGCGEESVVIHGAAIHIVKTADAAKVNVGSPIGFTLTVSNSGDGDARGVQLNDTLPTNPGLSWSIAAQGAGWAGSCSISAGVLSCGGASGVTVPAGTTQAASTFTVHIVSGTTAATAGDCPTTGVVDNTGNVTASNDGSDQSSASTCVQALVDLTVTKAGSPATQTLGDGNITWTIVVTNTGPNADTGVTIADPMPPGNTFVSASSTQGSCTGGAVVNCSIGTMAAGASVTITLVTTPSTVGSQTNSVTVAGNRPETNTGNNSATATVQTTQKFTPPPTVFCVAVSKVTPTQLFVGRKTKVTIHVTQHGTAVKGVHVRITGPKTNIRTGASNSKGVITQQVKMKKAGILIFSPIASKKCNTRRVGVTGVFTPPVTG
jgi:uncharacterized repeat protein (TIGR01451 family)